MFSSDLGFRNPFSADSRSALASNPAKGTTTGTGGANRTLPPLDSTNSVLALLSGFLPPVRLHEQIESMREKLHGSLEQDLEKMEASQNALFKCLKEDMLEELKATWKSSNSSPAVSHPVTKNVKDDRDHTQVWRPKQPIHLPNQFRTELESLADRVKGININQLGENYRSTAAPQPTLGVTAEFQVLREFLFSLEILDFSLSEKDTFFLLNLLQEHGALSSSDLKNVISAFAREEVQLRSFTDNFAEFMNSNDLSEELLFESLCSYVEVVGKRFNTQAEMGLRRLCRKLDDGVQQKVGDYQLVAKQRGRGPISMSLQRVADKAEAVESTPQPTGLRSFRTARPLFEKPLSTYFR